ncbi:MAG: hypothetical protein ACE5EY_06625 [Anaerolineae bacterium]
MHLAPEKEAPISQIADRICQRGWRLPVLLALEAGRPLAFVMGQLLWMAQPALSLVIPGQMIRQTAQFLEDPKAVNQLIACLDTYGS